MNEFLAGASMTASLGVALFFFSFWRTTRDRLFASFGVAFVIFAINRVVTVASGDLSEGPVAAYILRLLAFLVIIAAIVDKNRPNRSD